MGGNEEEGRGGKTKGTQTWRREDKKRGRNGEDMGTNGKGGKERGWGRGGGDKDGGEGRKKGDGKGKEWERWGEKKREGNDVGISLRPGVLDPLHLLVGHSRKRQNKRGPWESGGMGWWPCSGGGEPSGLPCFKIGIKQYFGFCAEFLACGGGWEAQTQRAVEMVQHSLTFLSTGPTVDGMQGPNMNPSSWQLRPHPPLPWEQLANIRGSSND